MTTGLVTASRSATGAAAESVQDIVLSGFQQRALKLAAVQADHVPQILHDIRERGADAFSRTPWPGRKVETWKYTSLQPLNRFEQADWGAAAIDKSALESMLARLPELEATRLVFVDGQFQAELSDTMPAGVSLFSAADAAGQEVLKQYLGQVASSATEVATTPRRNLFADLNDAWLQDGLLLSLDRNVSLEQPVYIVHISSSDAASVANQRVLTVLESGAAATLIEHFVSLSDRNEGFVNSLTEIHLGANARLHHTRLHESSVSGSHIGAVHLAVERDSVYQGFTLAHGSRLSRVDYQMNHRGQGASIELDGIYLARGDQLVDYHLTVEHEVPHCTTQEVFRGIIGDQARAVFSGKIHIHPDAQKTQAELHNRNLLTSNGAEIDTKPELEIYADDVRCAHGATISQLDEDALFYLKSRGVDEANGRMMLSFGFVNELIERLPDESMRTYLQGWLQNYFLQELASE